MLTRKLAAVALAAAAVAGSATPASAAAGPCRAQIGSTDGDRLDLVVTGQYVAGPTDDVVLGCYVIQGGGVTGSVTDDLPGGVAALAGVVEVQLAPFYVCYDVSIWDVTGWGYTHETNCPWGS